MLVSWRGLKKVFSKPHCVVTCQDAEVQAGQVYRLAGPSGSGKSTMLAIIGGLLPATDGAVTWSKEASRTTGRRELAFVFQDPCLTPYLTVWENATMFSRDGDVAASLLETCGLAGRMSQCAGTLSGGQQRRVAVVRALASRPQVLFADEPTSQLDEENARLVTELLARHVEDGGALLMATHESVDLPHVKVDVEAVAS
ncbi:ABC transporter ATP-binding protein [Acidipropionibacterium timonense]|uniref:ABC transporter ATP-binding protein n=1 Tax=Acidipropionibacterium timonense TaxID=2161818 RepID=UPI001031FED6|nr:ATP-binding cassette domain-containing protein [Acidipropionibacterium timonense]